MKKNELTKGVMVALLLTSSMAMAEEYPAADYQPKVLYTNPDYSSAKAAPAAPAPKAVVKEVETDPAYPATNFQPKVLYSDAGYKHSSVAPAAEQAAKSSGSTSSAEASVDVIQTEKAASSDFSYIGLVLLAVAGFFIYNKKAPKGAKSSVSGESYQVATGATGVEKYLEKVGANKTGVAKYLEKQDSNPATGVAKYMAKQIVRDREAAAAKATGVEKYLRDKA